MDENQNDYSLAQLASHLNADLQGDGDYRIAGLANVESAGPADISFISSKKYSDKLSGTAAGCMVLKKNMAAEYSGNALFVEDPYLAYAKLSRLLDRRRRLPAGVHPSAVVAESAIIAPSAAIGPQCVVGEHAVIGERCEIYPGTFIGDEASLGDDCLIHANVSIYHNVTIGNRAVIHAGSVFGSDGFGFAPSKDGWTKIHQLGGVIIGDDVDIGASTAIDRGALDNTIIEDGVIIDNQVHIAHNVKIGRKTAIAGCVGIAGSTTIGENCTVAGAVAINGHITIADNCHFNGGTIVTKGTDEPGVYASGTPFMEAKKWRRASVRYTQLDELANKVKALEAALAVQQKSSE